jgi:hypothetical protein
VSDHIDCSANNSSAAQTAGAVTALFIAQTTRRSRWFEDISMFGSFAERQKPFRQPSPRVYSLIRAKSCD